MRENALPAGTLTCTGSGCIADTPFPSSPLTPLPLNSHTGVVQRSCAGWWQGCTPEQKAGTLTTTPGGSSSPAPGRPILLERTVVHPPYGKFCEGVVPDDFLWCPGYASIQDAVAERGALVASL